VAADWEASGADTGRYRHPARQPPGGEPGILRRSGADRNGPWTGVDGEFAVWGDLPEPAPADLLSGRVANALRTLDGGVSVGDVGQQAIGAMAETVSEDADGTAGAIAETLLDMAGADDSSGPSRRVVHREEGVLFDPQELQNRAEAVAAVADAVERTER